MKNKKTHFIDLLLGRALVNAEIAGEKLNLPWGLPIMASDAVSSVAYALEEILLVLVPVLGLGAIGYLDVVALPIIILLLILAFSYSQIIDHYPNGGGSYVVSSENLGKGASLFAASALIVDYIMTVAVSLSSATAAFLAAFPSLWEYRVIIAIAFLSIVTLMNLRGVRESAKIFGAPTYGFIVIMMILIITGFIRFITGTLDPIKYTGVPDFNGGLSESLLILLLLKAFSSGCSALTGIEAVSNAVPSFKDPAQKTAKHVLYVLVCIIIFIFGGSVLLASRLHVIPLEGHTVISQMGMAIFGSGPMFYLLQFATSLILLLAANTAYNGLPNLLALLAFDNYMPHQFSQRGRKLSFSNGILFIYFVAGGLIIFFQADTHHLIPLYSVGVFLSFTLAQTGMVAKWFKIKGNGWKRKMLINIIGSIMSFVGMVIVFVTKFSSGAWMLGIAIPMISIIMYSIHKHYKAVYDDIRLEPEEAKSLYKPCTSTNQRPFIVLGSSFSRPFIKAINYANALSANVTAVHIATSDEDKAKFQELWKKSGFGFPLVIIEAPYRDIIPPIADYIEQWHNELPHNGFLTVVLVKFVENHFVDKILHNQTTYFIERRLKSFNYVATLMVHYIYKKSGKV
ncbi:APC family permease [Anaeropeptidivorans aminofermentans]|uniref:APC family permease n=1 Tax=Anaeropeptidivorans aminofermentans TaxID=2934315 RepID=UPI0020252C6C|nr:APC family permease [Anaeropeptidivorans aminofermentans]